MKSTGFCWPPSLRRCKVVTLEIDATEVEANKANPKWTYKGHRGDMPMVGHIAETDSTLSRLN